MDTLCLIKEVRNTTGKKTASTINGADQTWFLYREECKQRRFFDDRTAFPVHVKTNVYSMVGEYADLVMLQL